MSKYRKMFRIVNQSRVRYCTYIVADNEPPRPPGQLLNFLDSPPVFTTFNDIRAMRENVFFSRSNNNSFAIINRHVFVESRSTEYRQMTPLHAGDVEWNEMLLQNRVIILSTTALHACFFCFFFQ